MSEIGRFLEKWRSKQALLAQGACLDSPLEYRRASRMPVNAEPARTAQRDRSAVQVQLSNPKDVPAVCPVALPSSLMLRVKRQATEGEATPLNFKDDRITHQHD